MDNKKEKNYVKPELDIIIFQVEDIICSSPTATIPDEEIIP